MSYITGTNLVKRYGRGMAAVQALRGLDLSVEKGEFIAIMGSSGSGKSTLLSIMGGLNTPDEGQYLVDGIDVYSLKSDQRADFRRDYLGFVFQSFHLVNYLTLEENLQLPLVTRKMKKKEKKTLAMEALERVGLGDKAHRLPSEVSGGEQERAAVARALVNQPPILLADEPTGNLDQTNTRDIMALLCRLGGDGMTVIMVTHSPECAAYASRVIQVADGMLAGGREDDPNLPATLEKSLKNAA